MTHTPSEFDSIFALMLPMPATACSGGGTHFSPSIGRACRPLAFGGPTPHDWSIHQLTLLQTVPHWTTVEKIIKTLSLHPFCISWLCPAWPRHKAIVVARYTNKVPDSQRANEAPEAATSRCRWLQTTGGQARCASPNTSGLASAAPRYVSSGCAKALDSTQDDPGGGSETSAPTRLLVIQHGEPEKEGSEARITRSIYRVAELKSYRTGPKATHRHPRELGRFPH